MTPVEYDITIYAGSYFTLPLEWQTGDPPIGVDLTGCVIRMQIRKTVTSEEILYELTTENNRIIADDLSIGKFTLSIPSRDSENFDFYRGVYDLEVVYPSGSPEYRILQGSVTINPNVTRGYDIV